jgi:hypothetical protein
MKWISLFSLILELFFLQHNLYFIFFQCLRKLSFFLFLHLTITTYDMGIWWFEGAFVVVVSQSECGKRLNARQPASAHRRV